MTETNRNENYIGSAISWVASLLIAGALVYVGKSVTELNTTAAKIEVEIRSINVRIDRLEKLDSELISRREYDLRLTAIENTVNEIKYGKVKINR